MMTRRQARLQENVTHVPTKRKAMESPLDKDVRKRSAFGDLTNALRNVQIGSAKKNAQTSRRPNEQHFTSIKSQWPDVDGIAAVLAVGAKRHNATTVSRSLGAIPESMAPTSDNVGESRRPDALAASLASRTDQDRSASSLASPLTESAETTNSIGSASASSPDVAFDSPGLYDYDAENQLDPFNVPLYAADIFRYYKRREKDFKVGDYMARQVSVTKNMRAILVDWMVEIQENFELNHETLYQSVKMTDLYLDRKIIDKKSLQLVGTTALFISAKYDERCPPALEDFLYICDDAYTQKQLLEMERNMLKTMRFELGFPLSYRFLRRYAKATKTSMETLTLARYVLESSLLYYEYVQVDESLLAAACLLLALRMKAEGDWTAVHQKYAQYELGDVEPLMFRLNEKMKEAEAANSSLVNIKNKYSHELFFEVAKIPFLSGGGDESTPAPFRPDDCALI